MDFNIVSLPKVPGPKNLKIDDVMAKNDVIMSNLFFCNFFNPINIPIKFHWIWTSRTWFTWGGKKLPPPGLRSLKKPRLNRVKNIGAMNFLFTIFLLCTYYLFDFIYFFVKLHNASHLVCSVKKNQYTHKHLSFMLKFSGHSFDQVLKWLLLATENLE